MKPFDLEAAKRGEPIVTRDGRPVRFVAHVPEAELSERVVVFATGNIGPTTHGENGAFLRNGPTDNDLFMTPRTRTVYVNIHPHGRAYWHNTEEIASAAIGVKAAIATAVPVEIED